MGSHKTSPQAFSRARKLTFYSVMILILRKSVKSLQLCLNEFVTQTSKAYTITASAFTQARSKLSYTAFVELNNDIVKLYYQGKKNLIKQYKGYRLLGFDGCKITLPDNEETVKEFGSRGFGGKNVKNKKGRCVQTTYEACYDVLNNIAISGILGKGSVYEASLAQQMIGGIELNDIGYI